MVISFDEGVISSGKKIEATTRRFMGECSGEGQRSYSSSESRPNTGNIKEMRNRSQILMVGENEVYEDNKTARGYLPMGLYIHRWPNLR